MAATHAATHAASALAGGASFGSLLPFLRSAISPLSSFLAPQISNINISFSKPASWQPFHSQGGSAPLLRFYVSGRPKDNQPQLHVTVEPQSGPWEGISVLSLNRPEARNAIGRQMLRELSEAISMLGRERTTRCVVLRSLLPGEDALGTDACHLMVKK